MVVVLWGVLFGLYLLGPHSLLFCHRSGLSCWVEIAPETNARSMFCTVLPLFSHFFYVCLRYILLVFCVFLSRDYLLYYLS